MEREDGEMSDDNAMLVDLDEVPQETPKKTENHTVLYKSDKEGVVIKQLERVDAAKLEERAERFGLSLTGNRVITQKQIDELYSNFGVEGNERHFRFEAIYLNGVDGMSTPEIFEYLEDYKPISLEWIDEMSCNVVCEDHISAALALLLHSREIKSEELRDMLADKSDHHWREGLPHPKKDLILMRFATNGEKKKFTKKLDRKHFDEFYDQSLNSISKNPWGDLCQSWGVYDHQEVFQRKLPKNDFEEEIEEPRPPPIHIRNKKLAMRLGKRKPSVKIDSDDSDSDSEWKSKSKAPRMRMHADDEESRQKRKQAKSPEEVDKVENIKIQKEKYAPLSIEVANTRNDYVKREPTKLSDKFKFHGGNKQGNFRPSSIRSRLGEKVPSSNDSQSQSDESSDDSSSDSIEVNLTSKVQRVSSKSNSSSVWSRLETKNSSRGHSDLRRMLKSKTNVETPKQKHTNDLRSKLGKSKPANLRIEIDNHT